MSKQNAESNLQEFGKELGLQGLQFDENNTCILGIDDQFSLHITYEPNSNRLYLYSPILDGLPENADTKLKLYSRILEGTMLGGQVAGGGVGVAENEGLILLHCYIEMAHAEVNALRNFAPLYVETVEKWRKACEDIKERGTTDVDFTPGVPLAGGKAAPSGMQPPTPPGPGGGGPQKPGEGFIRA